MMDLPENRYEARRQVRHLVDRLEMRLVDVDYPEVPESAHPILQKYEERGAPLGPYWSFMPDELRQYQILKTTGTPDQLRSELEQLLDALDQADESLSVNMVADEGRLLGLFCYWIEERYDLLIRESQAAMRALENQGLTLGPEDRRLKDKDTNERPMMFINRVLRGLYGHMHPRYVEAWPNDTHRGNAKKNPQYLREHVQTLLRPYLRGDLPLDLIERAFGNAIYHT